MASQPESNDVFQHGQFTRSPVETAGFHHKSRGLNIFLYRLPVHSTNMVDI